VAKKRKRKQDGSNAPIAVDGIDKSWRARDDLQSLQRAREILDDTGRFRAAKSEAEKQKASLERIARLEGKKL
jgi:hypothetical protein